MFLELTKSFSRTSPISKSSHSSGVNSVLVCNALASLGFFNSRPSMGRESPIFFHLKPDAAAWEEGAPPAAPPGLSPSRAAPPAVASSGGGESRTEDAGRGSDWEGCRYGEGILTGLLALEALKANGEDCKDGEGILTGLLELEALKADGEDCRDGGGISTFLLFPLQHG